jgi:hypothetical protein
MLPMAEINFVVVLVAAVLNMVLGFMWYGPLFGKPWMQLVGISEDKIKAQSGSVMAKTYGITILAALVSNFVLAHWVDYLFADTLMEGIQAGIWAWLGFTATVTLTNALFGQKALKLWVIETSYWLVTFAINGALFAIWQ